jgi:DNA-directed RNA polymerase specialized sigma24 family protein
VTKDLMAVLEEARELYCCGERTRERGALALYKVLFPRFIKYFRANGQPESVVEELAHDTLRKVYGNVLGLEKPKAFLKWADTTARNTLLSFLRDTQQERKSKAEPGMYVEVDELESDEVDLASMEITSKLCLKGQIEKFARDEPVRLAALELVVFDEPTSAELGMAVQRSEAAAKEYLSQCRKKLWAYLKPCFDEN